MAHLPALTTRVSTHAERADALLLGAAFLGIAAGSAVPPATIRSTVLFEAIGHTLAGTRSTLSASLAVPTGTAAPIVPTDLPLAVGGTFTRPLRAALLTRGAGPAEITAAVFPAFLALALRDACAHAILIANEPVQAHSTGATAPIPTTTLLVTIRCTDIRGVARIGIQRLFNIPALCALTRIWSARRIHTGDISSLLRTGLLGVEVRVRKLPVLDDIDRFRPLPNGFRRNLKTPHQRRRPDDV